MVQTDSCDIMTGKNPDKASLFNVFHGKLDTAPIIRESPVCMGCTLYQNVDFPEHDLLVGEIQEAYAQAASLRHGEQEVLVPRDGTGHVLECRKATQREGIGNQGGPMP
jgi:flavin reductase (DIM6/NTAB) family NADH-FMN oxidoreductase RutF